LSLAGPAQVRGDHRAARALAEEGLTIARECGNKLETALGLWILGEMAEAQSDYGRARAHYEESLAIYQELGATSCVAGALNALGRAVCGQGDYRRARALHQESLALCWKIDDKQRLAASLEGMASLAAAEEQTEWAAHLLGAAAALREVIRWPPLPEARPRIERQIAEVRAALGEEAFAAAWAAGRAMPPEQAIADLPGEPSDL
jgi:hypothetical protein